MMVFPRRLCVDATSVVSVMRSHRCGRPGGTRAGGRTGGREPVMSNHRCGRPGGARAGRRARTSGRADGWAGGQTADEQAGGGPCPGLAQALPGPCLVLAWNLPGPARALPDPCLGPARDGQSAAGTGWSVLEGVWDSYIQHHSTSIQHPFNIHSTSIQLTHLITFYLENAHCD